MKNKSIALIPILDNINLYFEKLNHFRKLLDEIQSNAITYEKGLTIFSEIETCFLKDNLFDKTINDLEEYRIIHKDKCEYQLFLKFKLAEIFKNKLEYEDYPYLYELSTDWEELIELQRLPSGEILKLNHFLKVDYKFIQNQTTLIVSDYKCFIAKNTLKVIVKRLLNFCIQKFSIDIFLTKYEIDDSLRQFEYDVLYGRSNNKAEKLNESFKSFEYKYWHDGNKGTIAMEKAFNDLVENNFVSSKNTYRDFSNLFRGKIITNPIIWCGLKSDLSYFIKLLHHTHTVINQRPKDIYKITAKLFVTPDGARFETEKFKSDKPTSNSKILNNIVADLKGKEKTLPLDLCDC